MMRTLRPLPCPVDLFVLTADEFERHAREHDPLVRQVLHHGRDLLWRERAAWPATPR
jgi:hypothetical protein